MPKENQISPKNKIKLLLIAAICILPFIAAGIIYFLFPIQQKTNYGELIPIKPLTSTSLKRLDQSEFKLSELRGKWIMVQWDSSDCDQTCQNKLWIMRQVRLTQGKEMNRIERLWFVLDNGPVSNQLIREFEGTHIIYAKESLLLMEFPQGNSMRDHIYLIDPLGNLMLRFPKNPDPRRIVKDIGRLLKASRIG